MNDMQRDFEMKELAAALLSGIRPRVGGVVAKYYGIGDAPWQLKELAEEMHVSPVRAYQLKNTGLARMRELARRRHLPNPFVD